MMPGQQMAAVGADLLMMHWRSIVFRAAVLFCSLTA